MSNSEKFTFTCSVPPEGVHFVRSPPVRGTLDIVWSCFGVLLLSTWDIQPFSWVDTSGKPPARTKWAICKKHVSQFGQKLLVTAIAILMPEYITAVAVDNWARASKIQKDGAVYATLDRVDWNLAKAHYANMEGFRIEFTDKKSSSVETIRSKNRPSSGDGQELLSTTAIEEGDGPKPIHVTGEQLLYLRSIGVLDSLPEISSEELDDKNKSNGLLQMLALAQSLWLVVQVIVRHIEKLFITQLEIVTLAFAALSLVTRAIDWHRPKEIRTTTRVRATRPLTTEEEDQMWEIEKEFDPDESHKDISAAATTVVGLLFGGLHCLAWNEEFPTSIEQTLWRVAALTTTLLPLSVAAIRIPALDFLKIESYWIFFPLVLVYSIMRLFIMVETGRALFFQPPDTFRSTWTTNLPHLG